MRLDIYHHISDTGHETLVSLVKEILQQGKTVMAVLDDLTAQVKANTDAESSAITLIQNIAAALAAAGTDPVKLKALEDELKASGDALAAAVVANTPAG